MNKTRLEVIRIHEDVIVTSGLCLHLEASGGTSGDHVYVLTTGVFIKVKSYSHGENLTYTKDNQIAPFNFLTSPEINTWYYWNGTKYEKCEKQSNDAHPVK